MGGESPSVCEGIDETWLRAEAHADPVTHAFALWDLEHEREHARFTSLKSGARTVGYLLLWTGRPDLPVVHWVGAPLSERLAEALPRPPFLGVIPVETAPLLRTLPGEVRFHPLTLLRLRGSIPGGTDPRVRRLRASDRERLARFAHETGAHETGAYATADPEITPVFAAEDASGDILAAARAAVALPSVWMLGGVYTRPAHRGRGLGRAVTEAAARAGTVAGAAVALAVRDENAVARRLYESIGFVAVDRRLWVEARVPGPP